MSVVVEWEKQEELGVVNLVDVEVIPLSHLICDEPLFHLLRPRNGALRRIRVTLEHWPYLFQLDALLLAAFSVLQYADSRCSRSTVVSACF